MILQKNQHGGGTEPMNYDLLGSVCLIGDIHGEYNWYKYSEPVADNYIFLGDIGFGFDPLKSFVKELDSAIPNGVECYFIRGNHDDPSCWKSVKEKRIKELCQRFHMVHDYNTIKIGDKTFLCVGGGISVDRNYRIECKSYWRDEFVLPCPKKNVYGEIYGVLSHTGFVPPVITHKSEFQRRHPDVDKDCKDEQLVLNDILHTYKPKVWYNGHYHVHCNFSVEDCEVHILDISEHHILSLKAS